MADQISPWMISKIQAGEAVLFLGAGAAYGAEIDGHGQNLSGNKVRDLLCEKFLGNEQRDKGLVQVADYAKHQAGLNEVQNFIKNLFHPLQPSAFHKLIPLFRWHAIFATNYDLVIERAYDSVPKRLQHLAPILRDGDQFSSVMRDPEKLPYFKLHGCISSVSDETLPLILASEEYAKHKKNRQLLFQHLSTFGREHPIIFCGYQILDPNIQQILFDLKDIGISRPNYMVVDPGLNRFDEAMWQANRINTFKHTFSDFLTYINSNIDANKRILSSLIDVKAKPYSKKLKNNKNISNKLISYLELELEHIYKGMPAEGVQANKFYTGLDDEWGGVSQSLDFKRKINDQILIDSIIEESLNGSATFLIKGYAGSGKSIALRRVAWDAANDFDSTVTVFYLKKGAVFRPALVKELCEAIEGRVLLLIEDSLYNKSDLIKFYELLTYNDSDVSIITTARNNEWNQHGGDLEQFISSEYELDKLQDPEINELIEKLKFNNCLGNLKEISIEEIKNNFQLTSDRQLLVALHEATSGKSFEEIVFDEYQRIAPTEAQLLYMDVCTLNRLNVPVRAGLISRISNIGIEDFKKDFIAPLEHLVQVYMDQRSRDYVYACRHPLIAGLVFDYANANPTDKAKQLVRVISKMNIDYEADATAFIELIKGKNMASIFSDKALAKQVYEAAEDAGAPLHYVWHQRAVFELNHPGSDLSAALSAIQNAENNIDTYRSDKSILHTKALIYKKMANEPNSPLEKDKYRAEARLILEKLTRKSSDTRSYHTLAELALDELEDKLKVYNMELSSELQERAVLSIVKRAEDAIYTGLQSIPNDEYLLSSKANLARKLKEHGSVRKILEKAYRANDSSDYIAISLARNLHGSGDIEGAISIVRGAVAKSPSSRPLHLTLAKYLIRKNDQSNASEIMHHLKRSFSPNDTNYDAQFWFARQHYLYGNREEAIRIFGQLKKARMSPRQSKAIEGDSLDSSGNRIRYHGQVISDHVDFFFIRCSEINDSVFSHVSHFVDENTPSSMVGLEVSFDLAFTMRGPIAINVRASHVSD